MAMLAAIWQALHQPSCGLRWLALAGVLFALAFSARPSLLPAAWALLIPVVAWWRSHPGPARHTRLVAGLVAILAPILVVGMALALYNHARFQSPFEFGQGYQLAGDRQNGARHFSPAYLWYNFRLYFLSPLAWSGSFPFIQQGSIPPTPSGHGGADLWYGILVNTPVSLFAFAVPFCWPKWRDGDSAGLRWFVAMTAGFFATCALVLCAFYGITVRYQVEFHPMLVLLALIGLAGLLREWPPGRMAKLLWTGCLAYSLVFSILFGFARSAQRFNLRGAALFAAGDHAGAARLFEAACRLDPQFAIAWGNAGTARTELGDAQQAIAHYQRCLQLAPRSFSERANLAVLLKNQHRFSEAIALLQEGIRLDPSIPELHHNLGVVLEELGDHANAIAEFEATLRLQPDLAVTRYHLAVGLRSIGRVDEARLHYTEARRLRPDLPDLQF
jgi:Flp pilus assembly protein TadD